MTDYTALGDRMKRYEAVPFTSLTPRMPMIIRVDGRAFHTYTRRFKRQVESPWSPYIRDGMTAAAQALLHEISGAKIAYLQSDEISILVTDYDSLNTQPWFDKVAQKICSITAAIATAEFNQKMLAIEMSEQTVTAERPGRMTFTIEFPQLATFDSRCFVVPHHDVCNYFIWRQRDAEKNSVSMLAQRHFSPKQLHGKSGADKQDMLMLEKGVNWNDCEVWQKRGWCVERKAVTMTYAEFVAKGGTFKSRTPSVEIDPETPVTRTAVDPDWETPIFTKDRWYIDRHVDLEEAERRERTGEILDEITGGIPEDDDE